MRVGDIVQGPRPRRFEGPWYMYSAPPVGTRSTIECATDLPWRGGHIGIILEIRDDFIRVLTSAGHTGWIHTSWAMEP